MKKFFTLLAVAAMAAGASAQKTATFGSADISGQEKDTDVVCPGFTIAGTYFAAGSSKVDVYDGDRGMKLRTNKTDNTLVFTVDANTEITSLTMGLVTNNDSESITLSGVSVDGVAVADFTAVVLPNTGNADGTAVVDLQNISATNNISFTFDDSEYTGKNKQVFAAGVVTYQPYDGSGVSNVAVDENAPVEYFNLQGVRVANPENGLYIRRQGANATKVLVK